MNHNNIIIMVIIIIFEDKVSFTVNSKTKHVFFHTNKANMHACWLYSPAILNVHTEYIHQFRVQGRQFEEVQSG